MVAEKSNVIKILQSEIDSRKKGVLISVFLINIDELTILLEDVNKIVQKFYNIIDVACQISECCKIIEGTNLSKIYIIINNDSKLAEDLAYSIYSQVQLYVDREHPESYLHCSVGSIAFPQHEINSVEKLLSLLNYSSFNLNDKTYYFNYDDNPVNIEVLRSRNKRLSLLRSAIVSKTAKFMYQPIIDRKTGKVSYHECLLRIKDENNQWVSVGPMISDAESKNLINIIDMTVIGMAIEELNKDKDLVLSVNISNIGLLNKRLLLRTEDLLRRSKVAARLIIEITETSFNHDFENTKNFIDTLHKYGCRFALDDFGSGFTSFKQLLNLPIDIIKIDGSYIRDILVNDHSRFFVESLIKLGGDLGIKTVAEFVENGEIAKYLIDVKIDAMQGDFFLPASDSRIN